jgi:hypothetical protein
MTKAGTMTIAGTAVAIGIGIGGIGTETETETEIETVIITAMTTVDGAILDPDLVLDIVHALALALVLGSRTVRITGTVIVAKIEIKVKTKKKTQNLSGRDLALVCLPHHGNGLVHPGGLQASLILTAMYLQLATEVGPLVAASVPQNERSGRTDHALLKLIDIYPAETETENEKKSRTGVANLVVIGEHEGEVLVGGAEAGKPVVSYLLQPVYTTFRSENEPCITIGKYNNKLMDVR